MTVTEIYEQTVKPLPAAKRLRLATLILDDLLPEWVAEYSDEWSEEDYRDFTRASWQHIEGAPKE